MPAPALLPPPGGDRSRAPQLLALYFVQGAISILIVALRFYVRYAKRIIGSEDWAMLICLILYMTGSALLPVLTHYGVGRHIYYVPLENLPKVLRWNWIIQPFGILAQPFGKISVAIFLLKLMGPNKFWRKWLLYCNLTLFSLFACLCVVFTFAQCNPSRALWEKVPGAKCWKPDAQSNFSIATAAFGALFDFELSLLPITIFWNLKIDLRSKIGLYVLLGASGLSGIAATLKAIQLRELAVRTDVTWDTYTLYAWSSTELFLNILCGSIPTLKPLYDKWATGRAIGVSKESKDSGSSSYQLKRRSQTSNHTSGTSTSNNPRPMPASSLASEGAIIVTRSYEVVPKDLIISEREMF